ncbi:hypothetical protein CCP3SC15_140002 [Gammaproteobacteria bacterium]
MVQVITYDSDLGCLIFNFQSPHNASEFFSHDLAHRPFRHTVRAALVGGLQRWP